MRLSQNMELQLDMYAGGAGMALVGHFADQAATPASLSKYNVTNAEALYGLDIILTALFRKKLRGHTGGIADAAVAYSAGALTDRFLKGRFSSASVAPTSSTTGWEVSDPQLGQGWTVPNSGQAPAPVSVTDYGEESATGFGID